MPNRIIKDSICSSDDFEALSWFEQSFFIRLIVTVDDFGRMDARPAILKGRMFPLSNVTERQINDALAKLSTAGMVLLYKVSGKPYLQLTAFGKHQTPRAKESRYPAPENICTQMQADENICTQMQADATDIRIRYSNSINDIRYSESTPAHEEDEAHKRGAYGWVKLTDAQYDALLRDLGEEELRRCITYVDESAQSTGNKNKWKDWNLVLRKCSRNKWGIYEPKKANPNTPCKCETKPIDMDKLNQVLDRI